MGLHGGFHGNSMRVLKIIDAWDPSVLQDVAREQKTIDAYEAPGSGIIIHLPTSSVMFSD